MAIVTVLEITDCRPTFQFTSFSATLTLTQCATVPGATPQPHMLMMKTDFKIIGQGTTQK